MGHIFCTERNRTRWVAAAALACASSVVCAQGVPIEDDDLADVWGQAMFSVDNRAAAGFDFTRITLNADLKLNANFSNIQAGPLGDPVVNIGALNFVRSNVDGVELPYVQLADPYIELVYKNQASTEREIIGARIGFGSINGDLGTLFTKLRGNILITDGMDTPSGVGTVSLSQAAGVSSNFACTGTGSGCVNGSIAMSQVGQVRASGPTDFFISLLSQGVSDFGDGTSSKPASSALEGISVNWTQGLSYRNITGQVLGNPLPPLPIRQGN